MSDITTTPATPAVVSTPAVPSPQVSPGPRHPRPTPNATNTTRKAYGTGVDGTVRPGRQVTPQAIPAAAPEPVAAAPAAEPEPAPAAPADAPSDAPAPAADAAPAAPTETPSEPAEPAPPALDDAEMARRVATIARAERRLQQSQQKFADEKKQHAADLDRVKQMNDASGIAKKDPVGFLHRMFGVTPQQIVDQLIGIQNRKPEDVVRERENTLQAKIDEFQRKLDEADKKTQELDTRRKAQEYVQTTISPLVSDSTKYKFLNHRHGTDAAAVVYNTMMENYNRTGTARQPQAVADFIEKTYRDEAAKAAQLLGVSASPVQPQATPKKAATPAQAQAVAQQPPATFGRRVRLTGKPYTTQPK